MARWLFLSGCSLATLPAQVATTPVEGLRDASPRVHAITGARIVTAPGAVIERGTVVLRDGLIEAVGAEPAVKVPADARLWPADGKTVYAGFVEPLSEVHAPAGLKAETTAVEGEGGRRGGRGAVPATPTETMPPAAVARSWNPRVTPERDMARVLVADDRGASALRELGFASAAVAPGRGIFRGESALVSLSGRGPGATLLRPNIAQHVAFELGGFGAGYPSSLMGCIALIRQTLLDAQWHGAAVAARARNTALQRPEANASLQALQGCVAGAKPVVFDAADELDLLRAQKIADEFKLRAVLRGRGTEYRMAASLAEKKTPVIVPLNFPTVPEVETPEKAADVALSTLQHWELAPANAARLAAKGVPVAFTTAGLRAPDSQFWPAVRLAVKRGFAPDAALAALTTTPAQMLGVADLVGTIAPGKLGHLLVASGDLFAADSTAEVTELWVDGIHFETEAAQRIDARGTWKVAWRGATAPEELRIESRVTGGPGGPSTGGRPRARLGDKDLTLAQSRGQLTLLAPADLFQGKDAKGTVRLAGTVVPAGTGGTIDGTGLLPDGTAFRWSAERSAAAEKTTPPAPREEKLLATAEAWPAGAYARSGIPAQPEWILVKNATIWTSGSLGRVAGADLLVHSGKIEKVAKNLTPPAGAVVIDAAGKHVTAGLIDCHSHTAVSRGVNEGGSAVTVEVRVGDVLDATDVSIYRQLGGGVTVANILHGSANPMGGQNQVIKLRWGALPEGLKFAGAKPGVKFALGENVKQSNRTLTPGTTLRYPATRMGVEQIMADTFAQARDYERQWKDYKEGAALPPRRNLRLESALEMLKGERVIHIHSYRQDEVLMFIRLAQREKLTVATFQHILEGYKVADEIAKLGAGGSCFTDWWAYKAEVGDAIPYDGALMHSAGVVVSFNSDDNELARRLNTEAAKAMKYGGVPEEEALKFVTLNPAKQLRIDDRVGSLEVGKDADFVIWSASPLSTYTRAEQTWIDGRCYFSLDDDAALRKAATTEREALAQKALTERSRALAGGAGAPAGAARRGGEPPAAEPPNVLRVLRALEERAAREYQSIYHDGGDACNCSTHALQ
ncbi:MAG: amidohydrolase family protein [Verrucomicrobia bacterium]|nr:amidohydrolase family protein [Verrucomicrobiota bacterium]